jgi:uracil-DNA glycosylase
MIVGEQPGDQEDLRGQPFVGPAGRLLDRAFARLGWARETLYLTNAVRHFKFELRGWHRRADGLPVFVTLHPAALLRMEPAEAEGGCGSWVADLALAGALDN